MGGKLSVLRCCELVWDVALAVNDCCEMAGEEEKMSLCLLLGRVDESVLFANSVKNGSPVLADKGA